MNTYQKRLGIYSSAGRSRSYRPSKDISSPSIRYGTPSLALPRQIIGRGEAKKPSIELFPPQFYVARLVPEDYQITLMAKPNPPVVLSSGETVATLHGKLADAILQNTQSRPIFRVWTLEQALDGSFDSPQVTPRFLDEKSRILEPRNVTIEESGIQTGDAFIVEFMGEGGGWIMGSATTATARPKGEPTPIFNSSEGFFNRMSNTSPYSIRSAQPQTLMKAFGTIVPRSTAASHSNAFRKIEPGTLGLGNMCVDDIVIILLLTASLSLGEIPAS